MEISQLNMSGSRQKCLQKNLSRFIQNHFYRRTIMSGKITRKSHTWMMKDIIYLEAISNVQKEPRHEKVKVKEKRVIQIKWLAHQHTCMQRRNQKQQHVVAREDAKHPIKMSLSKPDFRYFTVFRCIIMIDRFLVALESFPMHYIHFVSHTQSMRMMPF